MSSESDTEQVEIVSQPVRYQRILIILYRHGPMTLRQILEHLHSEFNDNTVERTMRRLLRSMHRHGLITREPLNRKTYIYRITMRGMRLLCRDIPAVCGGPAAPQLEN